MIIKPLSLKFTRLRKDRLVPFALFNLFTLALALLTLSGYSFDAISTSLFVLCNIAIAALSFGFLWISYLKSWELRFAWLLAIMNSFLGPLGPLMTLATFICYLSFTLLLSHSSLLELLYPEHSEDQSLVLYERIIYGLEEFDPKVSLIAFKDIMQFGSSAQKRLAIEKILKNYQPQFSEALFQALNDKDGSVRVHAATALIRIDTQFFSRLTEIEKRLKLDPTNPQLLLSYANTCLEFANSQILDDVRLHRMVDLGLNAYQKYLNEVPYDQKTLFAMAELYTLKKEYQKAYEILQPTIQDLHMLKADEAEVWMNTLFHLKRYNDIKHFNKEIQKTSDEEALFQNIYAIQTLWKEELDTQHLESTP